MTALAIALILILYGLVVGIVAASLVKWRIHKMSRQAELAQAVQSLTDAVNALAARIGVLTQNVTPDSEIDAQLSNIASVTSQINTLAT